MVASALKHEEQGDAPPVLWRRLNTLATLLVVAGVVYLFLSISGVNRASMARLPDLINGTAYRPWVYRVLVPKTVGLLVALTPDAVADGLEQLFEDTPEVVTLMRQLVVRPADYVAAFYMSCVLFASLLGYKRAFRYLAASFYAEHWTLELASYIALAALVPFFQFCYIYDFTALFSVLCC